MNALMSSDKKKVTNKLTFKQELPSLPCERISLHTAKDFHVFFPQLMPVKLNEASPGWATRLFHSCRSFSLQGNKNLLHWGEAIACSTQMQYFPTIKLNWRRKSIADTQHVKSKPCCFSLLGEAWGLTSPRTGWPVGPFPVAKLKERNWLLTGRLIALKSLYGKVNTRRNKVGKLDQLCYSCKIRVTRSKEISHTNPYKIQRPSLWRNPLGIKCHMTRLTSLGYLWWIVKSGSSLVRRWPPEHILYSSILGTYFTPQVRQSVLEAEWSQSSLDSSHAWCETWENHSTTIALSKANHLSVPKYHVGGANENAGCLMLLCRAEISTCGMIHRSGRIYWACATITRM